MSQVMLRHQKTMQALRQQMGWPLIRPVNNCIAFSSGRPCDIQVGAELGRIAAALNQDIVYSGWTSVKSAEPKSYTVAYRDLFCVNIADRLVPYAANDDAPVMLVSTQTDEIYSIDARGTLTRLSGKPKDLARGRKLAAKRIRAAMAEMRDDLLAENRHIPWGSETIPQAAPANETVVRFG